MRANQGLLFFWIFCLCGSGLGAAWEGKAPAEPGCREGEATREGEAPAEPGFREGKAPAEPAQKSEAIRLWEQGQEALLDGRTEEAIALYQKSRQLEPTLARNYLNLAAAYAEKGQDDQAASWLEIYLRLQPDHFGARVHYAELLLRLKRTGDSRAQFERFIADIQDNEELATQHLIHCHSRLMEIAEVQEDDYHAHLHRGIGLYHLARQRVKLPEDEKMVSSESLLCRAAGELTLARLQRPDEARPSWYLYAVWKHLAQSQPAGRALCAAQDAAPFSYLTPAEQRSLRLAWRHWSEERQRK